MRRTRRSTPVASRARPDGHMPDLADRCSGPHLREHGIRERGGRCGMATYIMLSRLTDQGARTVKEHPGAHPRSERRACSHGREGRPAVRYARAHRLRERRRGSGHRDRDTCFPRAGSAWLDPDRGAPRHAGRRPHRDAQGLERPRRSGHGADGYQPSNTNCTIARKPRRWRCSGLRQRQRFWCTISVLLLVWLATAAVALAAPPLKLDEGLLTDDARARRFCRQR